MSNHFYTSYSYASSHSSSTDSSGTSHSHRFTKESHSNDRDGTTVRCTMQESGKPMVEETTTIPAGEGSKGQGRIEDMTGQEERDREYLERMEEEYAKREGGA